MTPRSFLRALVPILVVAAVTIPHPVAEAGGNCANATTGLVALTDLGGSYRGEPGHLYEGSNTMPEAHAAAAPDIAPIDGLVGFISMTMSNGRDEWQEFMSVTRDVAVDPSVVLVNGGFAGQTAKLWADPASERWGELVQKVVDAGLRPDQVQVAWVKHASRKGQIDEEVFPTFEARVEGEAAWIRQAIENAVDHFPNLRRVYLSSRIYAGYSTNGNHEEPLTGYENGFTAKRVVADSITGELDVWAAWGPYLWADGTAGRSDGLTWECDDFDSDGVHPSESGTAKVASLLLDFFTTDPTTCSWFLADCDGGGGGGGGGGIPLPGGETSVGLVDPSAGEWHMLDASGVEAAQFFFGDPGDVPIVGDWDGDGIDTPGMYRQSDGFVYLRNSNTQGVADIEFFFGNPGDVPIVGDFDGDRRDTVSIYRPSQGRVFIINDLGEDHGGLGAAEMDYFFGNPGDKPFIGDFDGDGVDTIGLHRESTGLVYFRNSHTAGVADLQFIFGNPGDRLVAGDWTGDDIDTPALFRPSDTTFYFRYTNTQGNADLQFAWGEPGWLPVAGDFGEL